SSRIRLRNTCWPCRPPCSYPWRTSPTITRSGQRGRFVMSIRYIGLSFVLLAALSGCGGETQAKSPDGSVGGPVTDIDRLYPLQHNTVFSYATTDETGQTGIYVIEVGRPRTTMAE